MDAGKWYESRKLWYALGAAVIVTGFCYGASALGLSESLVATVALGLIGLAVSLLGAHTATDIAVTPQTVSAGLDTNRIGDVIAALSKLISPILRVATGADEPAVGATSTAPATPSVVAPPGDDDDDDDDDDDADDGETP